MNIGEVILAAVVAFFFIGFVLGYIWGWQEGRQAADRDQFERKHWHEDEHV